MPSPFWNWGADSVVVLVGLMSMMEDVNISERRKSIHVPERDRFPFSPSFSAIEVYRASNRKLRCSCERYRQWKEWRKGERLGFRWQSFKIIIGCNDDVMAWG
jgi:hypothetical protein